jgi:hypothetical protein
MDKDKTHEKEPKPKPRRSFTRQLYGMVGGGCFGLILVEIFPWLTHNTDRITIILWCSVIGIVIFNIQQFETAGAVLTQRENRPLNTIVGLGFPLLILLIIFFLINLIFVTK